MIKTSWSQPELLFFYRNLTYKGVPQWLIHLEQLRLEAIPPRLNQKLRIKYKVMAVLSSSVEFAWQAAENLSEGGVVRLLMTALQQLECLLMTTFPRTERLLMTILCSACQCFFLLWLFPTYILAQSFILHQHVIVGLRPDLCFLSLHVAKSDQVCQSCYNCSSMFLH